MQDKIKRASVIMALITALSSALSVGATLLYSNVIGGEFFALILPALVVSCEYVALVSISVSLTVIFAFSGVKKVIANSLLPLFIYFALIFVRDILQGALAEGGNTIDLIVDALPYSFAELLIFAAKAYSALIIAVLVVKIKSKKKLSKAVISKEIADASALKPKGAVGAMMLSIPLYFFAIEFVSEVISTVLFFSESFDTLRPYDLVYICCYYLYLILLFAVGLFVCRAVKEIALGKADAIDGEVSGGAKK